MPKPIPTRVRASSRLAFLVCSLVAASASARPATQPTTPPPAEGQAATTAPAAGEATATPTAQELFARGENAYRLGDYDGAVRDWQAAYQLDPRPRILYNLSQAYERLGRLEEAAAALESYLQQVGPDDPYYATVNARLQSLRMRLSQTGLVIRQAPDGGRIAIDGQAWGLTPRPDRIPLPAGSHRVEITYEDGRRFTGSVVVAAAQVAELVVNEADLQAGAVTPRAPVVDAAELARRQRESELRRSRILLWTGVGVAAAGAGVLSYGIARSSALSTCTQAPYYCLDESAGTRQRNAGLITGSVALAAGVGLLVWGIVSKPGDDAPPARAMCVPGLLGGACAVSF